MSVPASYPRPEDFDAEEPEAAEVDAFKGRQQVGELEGPAALVALLASDIPSVLCGAANALYNLALDAANADALLPLGALPKLMGLLEKPSELYDKIRGFILKAKKAFTILDKIFGLRYDKKFAKKRGKFVPRIKGGTAKKSRR